MRDVSQGTIPFTIAALSGNVGLHTTNPQAPLEIGADGEGPIIRFKRSDLPQYAGIGATAYGKSLIFYAPRGSSGRMQLDFINQWDQSFPPHCLSSNHVRLCFSTHVRLSVSSII